MTMPIRRTIKNVVKNYSDAQIKVREATSNDPWGPSSTLMSEIADLTYNVLAFTEIMQMIWKRLNDHGKNWRHVYKSLVLLDYIIKTGSEKVAQQCKENIFAIQTLKDFQFVEDAKDHGQNVREKAKQLVSLLKDDDRLKNERAKALKAKERFALTNTSAGSGLRFGSGSPTLHTSSLGFSESVVGTGGGYSESGGVLDSELEAARPTSTGEEELQLQLALVMSKEEHEEEMKRLKGDEVKLQMAIEQSKKEQMAAAAAAVLHEPSVALLDVEAFDAAAPDPWMSSSSSSVPSLPPHLPPPPSHSHLATQSDPWAPDSVPSTHDPWTSSPSRPTGQHQRQATAASAVINDPWKPSDSTPVWSAGAMSAGAMSAGAMSTGASNSSRSSPWESPSRNQPAFAQNAANAGGAFGGGEGGVGVEMEEEFDLLSSSRSKSPLSIQSQMLLQQQQLQHQSSLLHPGSSCSTPSQSTGGSIPVVGMGSNPWDMSGVSHSLMDSPSNQPARRKSPKEFLGENASLVNLDNLVSRPAAAAGVNPFAALAATTTTRSPSPATNPFAAQQQAGRSTPLNQLSTSSTAFVQQATWGVATPPQQQHVGPSSSPALPMYAAGTAAYPPGYNPFL